MRCQVRIEGAQFPPRQVPSVVRIYELQRRYQVVREHASVEQVDVAVGDADHIAVKPPLGDEGQCRVHCVDKQRDKELGDYEEADGDPGLFEGSASRGFRARCA